MYIHVYVHSASALHAYFSTKCVYIDTCMQAKECAESLGSCTQWWLCRTVCMYMYIRTHCKCYKYALCMLQRWVCVVTDKAYTKGLRSCTQRLLRTHKWWICVLAYANTVWLCSVLVAYIGKRCKTPRLRPPHTYVHSITTHVVDLVVSRVHFHLYIHTYTYTELYIGC